MKAPLAVGDRAWAIVHGPPTPSTRRLLVGAALVRVEAIDVDGQLTARVLRGSGVPEGHRLVLARHDMYACADHGEHVAFGLEVARLWGAI